MDKNKPPKVLYRGALTIGETPIACAVLDTEQRVISETSMTEVMLGSRSGAAIRRKKESEAAGAPLPVFFSLSVAETLHSQRLKGRSPFNHLS